MAESPTGTAMKVGHNVAELQKEHVELDIECIGRMYLSLFVPGLQSPVAVAWFIRERLGARFASSALLAPIGESFVASIRKFCTERDIELRRFKKGERKDDVAAEYLREFLAEHAEFRPRTSDFRLPTSTP